MVRYGIESLFAVMYFNIVLTPSPLQVVFHIQHIRFIAVTSLGIKKQQNQF